MLIREIVFLGGKELVIDMIMMDMLDFDMILGMDFLSRYEVEIDCKKKKGLV